MKLRIIKKYNFERKNFNLRTILCYFKEMLFSDLVSVLLDVEKMYLEIGAGYTEAMYQNAVKMIFQNHGYTVSSEMPVPYIWSEIPIGAGRYDLVVSKANQSMIVELKATVNKCLKWNEIKQLKNYMSQKNFNNGIIINFPQVDNQYLNGIYFYSLLNCSWNTIIRDVQTSLGIHMCILKTCTADEIQKDELNVTKNLGKSFVH